MVIRNTMDRFALKISILAVIIMLPLLAACSGSNTVSARDVQIISQGLNGICGRCDEILSECDCVRALEVAT